MSRPCIGDYTEEQAKEMVSLYSQGWTIIDLRRKFGGSWEIVRRVLTNHGAEIRFGSVSVAMRKVSEEEPGPDGTDLAPEVAEAARQIRDGWDEEECRRRAGIYNPDPWEVPRIKG